MAAPGRPDQPRTLPIGKAAAGGLRHGFAALGVRNYRLYWSGQLVSLTGTWMQQVSLPWLVLALGGSPIQLGLVAMLQFGPALFLAPFGGVLADRIDKRKALIAAQIAAMAEAVVLFALTATGIVEIPMVMALAFWLGLVNAVEMPVRQALAADLVPRHVLANAIALNSMAFNSARVVGPALAGVIIAAGTAAFGSTTAGVAGNLAINAVSYLAVLAGLLLMNPDEIRRMARPERHPAVLSALAEGIRYAWRAPLVLWPLVLLAGIAAFGFNFQILVPLFAQEVLAFNADGYGALLAVLGLGSLAGSLTLAFMRRRRAIALMLGGGLAFGVAVVGLGTAGSAWLAFPLVAAAGYFSMLMINTVNATIQANVTDALRGRVMALYVTVFAGSAPLGSLFAGAVAESVGPSAAFLASGALSLVVIAVVAWRLRIAAARHDLGVTMIDSAALGPREPAATAGAAEPRLGSAMRR